MIITYSLVSVESDGTLGETGFHFDHKQREFNKISTIG